MGVKEENNTLRTLSQHIHRQHVADELEIGALRVFVCTITVDRDL